MATVSVTYEDVLDYLDKSPIRAPEFSSKSIFFSFIPLSEHHINLRKKFSKKVELRLPMDYLEKIDNKPVIVGPDRQTKFSTWKYIKSPSFMKKVIIGANKKPDEQLFFRWVPHLAVKAYYIPFNKFQIINN